MKGSKLFVLIILSATFQYCSSDVITTTSTPPLHNKKTPAISPNPFGSSTLFPVKGSIQEGYYYTNLKIDKSYSVDIDTGSELTWVICDAYPPPPLKSQEIEYSDGSSSTGTLVRDYFHILFTNGSILRSSLVFGCGTCHPPESDPNKELFGDGVLGLANVLSGHQWLPYQRITTTTRQGVQISFLITSLLQKNLDIVFDSGATYVALTSQAYQAALEIVQRNLDRTPLVLVVDAFLEKCWGWGKRIKSINEVKKYFKSMALNFTNARNFVQFQLPPQSYLIISPSGNVCFGISYDSESAGLNIIADIAFQDKLVVYDNERKLIGWASSKCIYPPRVEVDRDQESNGLSSLEDA
ncbi:Aspartic proteinase Asp1 [Camellia lanceoleosa]|uniref:Aspartic proteinase Asp1 n=1 Tax=Camellia lanceoleosa TaxID=1840588 RepID=A0ACC0HLK5_9ERIC|nr:Aspartic proteinase Asp1 [Camellia lanceoleosa]